MAMPVATGGNLFVRNFTNSAPTEFLPVMFADGSFAIVWTGVDTALDPEFSGIFMQRCDASGLIGGVIRINTVTTKSQNQPDVVLLDNGNLLVSWYSDTSAPPPPAGTFNFGGEMVAQIVSPTGALIGGEIILPAAPYGVEQPGTGTPPRTITALPGGGFAATWVDYPGGIASAAGSVSAQMRIFNTSGMAITGDIVIDSFGGITSFDKVDVDTTTDGRIFVSYRERITSTTKQSYGAFYEADGDPIGTAFSIGAVERNAYKSLVESLSGGRIVYVYEGAGASDYRVVLLNETGVAISTPVSLGEKGDLGSVVERPDGGFIVTFTDTTIQPGISNNDVLMQGFTSTGALDGPPIPLSGALTLSHIAGNASPVVNNRMVTVWLEGFGLSAQVYSFSPQPTSTADLLTGSANGDLIDALGGNDTVNGLGGNDTLFGGDGADDLVGGAGNDILWGGTENDRLFGDDGNDILLGETGSDQLFGWNGADAMYGWEGNDTFYGDAGNDTLFGEQGNDLIIGGADNDLLFGGIGFDTLFGEAGDDTLLGETGEDLLWGGDGADVLFGWEWNDTLFGEAGNDTLFGEQDNDVLYGWVGADLLWGGDGNDTLWGEQDNDTLLGEAGNDVLLGIDGNDVMFGWVGNDSLFGWTGDDVLWGEQGNDLMLGEDGNDVLIGGLGRDTMTGGQGADRFFSAFSEIAAGEVDLITDFDAADRYLFQTGAQIQYFNFNAPGYGVGAGIHVQVAGGVFILDVLGANASQLQAQTLFF